MKIEAKVLFKHGYVMEFLKKHCMTIRELSRRSGWKYQNLLGFTSLLRIPMCENRGDLLAVMQSIDPGISEESLFPNNYNKYAEVFYSRTSVHDIPTESLIPYEECKMLEAPDGIDSDRMDAEHLIGKAYKVLTDRQMYVIKHYYGIMGCDSMTFDQLAKKLNMTAQCVRIHRNNGIKRMYKALYREVRLDESVIK